MKIGVGIIFGGKLTKYLDAVKKCFDGYDCLLAMQFDFKVTPEHEARNLLLKNFGGYDLVFLPDADELILKADQQKLIEGMKYGNAGMCKVIDYKNTEEIIIPKREHTPIIIAKPDLDFYDGRCAHLINPLYFNDINIHHFGFCFDKEILDWKKANYWNAKDPNEFGRLMEAQTERMELPGEIRDYLKEIKC